MSIKLKHQYYEMYGRTRFFKADRCINNESIRAFNKYKINAKEQILLVIIRPDNERVDEHIVRDIESYEFCGYDLVEVSTYISAITNCGAEFDKAIDYENLNEFGLISKYLDGVKSQILLRKNYPDESHGYCELVEVWRKLI